MCLIGSKAEEYPGNKDSIPVGLTSASFLKNSSFLFSISRLYEVLLGWALRCFDDPDLGEASQLGFENTMSLTVAYCDCIVENMKRI